MRSKHTNHGFTLVELIIVIAILGVLIAIFVPKYIQYAEKARTAVCNSNCTQMQRYINMEKYFDEQNFGHPATIVLSSPNPCTSGGKVTANLVDGFYVVTCEKHGATTENPNIGPIKVIEGMSNIKVSNNTQMHNEYFKNNGGKWDTMTVGGITYYIQPYYDQKTKEYRVFANRISSCGANWTANLIFHDGVWYQYANGNGDTKPTTSITNSWDKLQESISKPDWTGKMPSLTPVDVQYN